MYTINYSCSLVRALAFILHVGSSCFGYDQVGPDDHAICALSGGVDSTVAATLVHQVLGDRLHCVFVDNGLLRFEERKRVDATFNDHLHLPVTTIDASKRFLDKLAGVTDPEKKRKVRNISLSLFLIWNRKTLQALDPLIPTYLHVLGRSIWVCDSSTGLFCTGAVA